MILDLLVLLVPKVLLALLDKLVHKVLRAARVQRVKRDLLACLSEVNLE